jgi:type 1 glutamine amidotransferase
MLQLFGVYKMNKYTYNIVDSEGYVLLTVTSQFTNRSIDDEAKVSVSPLLPVIAKQYGLGRVYWEVMQ